MDLKRWEKLVPHEMNTDELLHELAKRPKAPLAQLPTPIHRLENFGRRLNGPELWVKRDDLTGLEGGGTELLRAKQTFSTEEQTSNF